MLTGRPRLNAALGPPQWPYGTTSRDMDQGRSFEPDIRSQSSPSSRPLYNGLSPVDVFTNPTSMLHINAGGFGMSHSVSPISPLCSPRPILGCNDWNLPSTTSPVHRNGSVVNSPTGSDGSTFSSLDISDLMSSLSLSPPRRLFSAPTEQEMANLRALHTLTSGPMMQTVSAFSPPPQLCSPQLDSNRPWSLRDNVEHFNRAVNITQSTTTSGGTVSWNGELPRRFLMSPTYSCKVFLGGVPWDVTEETLVFLFMQFGRVRVEWPGKENSAIQPKGYVYIIFETENQVKMLLNSCTRDISNGNYENYYFRIYSRKMKSKAVQVIPWRISDSNHVLTPSEKLDPHTTVFVGGLHGMLSAEGLYKIMDDLFGGVIYVGIDTDKFKYPIGSARVTFNNKRSYIKAVMAAFVEIKTSKFVKKVQVDPYLEDAVCSNCVVHSGPYFCRDLSCFRYFCPGCWMQQHQSEFQLGHRPLVRTSKYSSNASSPHTRFAPH